VGGIWNWTVRSLRALAPVVLLLVAPAAWAQQPFVTDDAEVTPLGQWHFEYFNEFAVLAKTAAPDLRQDWNNFVIQYGAATGLELNVDFPILYIQRAMGAALPNAFGLGDVDFAAKYQIVYDDPASARPAFTLEMAVEVPTGDKSTQLGSGYTDLLFNSVLQKTLAPGTVVHVNIGYQFSGNTLTGAIGIRTPGRILTGGVSVAHEFSQTLLLGIDLNGAQTRTSQSRDSQVQLTMGGSLAVKKNATFDFALLAGRSDAPRFGILLGMSYSP
jgi:hypothetical protein